LWALDLDGYGDDVHKVKEKANLRLHWIWDKNLEREVLEDRQIMLKHIYGVSS